MWQCAAAGQWTRQPGQTERRDDSMKEDISNVSALSRAPRTNKRGLIVYTHTEQMRHCWLCCFHILLYHTIPYHTIAVAIKFRKTPNIVGILWKMCVLSTFSFYTNASIVRGAARVLLAEWKLLNENAILFFLFFWRAVTVFGLTTNAMLSLLSSSSLLLRIMLPIHTHTHTVAHLYGVEN